MPIVNINRVLKALHILFVVWMAATLIGMSFVPEIYSHRMKAIFSVVGLALIVQGIRVLLDKKIEYEIRNRSTGVKTTVNQTGKKAKKTGYLLTVVGGYFFLWGVITFWIPFILGRL